MRIFASGETFLPQHRPLWRRETMQKTSDAMGVMEKLKRTFKSVTRKVRMMERIPAMAQMYSETTKLRFRWVVASTDRAKDWLYASFT